MHGNMNVKFIQYFTQCVETSYILSNTAKIKRQIIFDL
jgi:hypothetical protein